MLPCKIVRGDDTAIAAGTSRHRLRPRLLQRRVRFRTDAEFGLALLRKYRSDETVLQTWLALARAMGGMMYPSLEGMRNAGHLLHRLGALPKPVPAEDSIDLELIATAEREGFFETFMGRAAGS